jgi:nucleoside-diphosphate-sugar epimerase
MMLKQQEMEKTKQRTAIVIGATGIVGRAITAALANEGKWKVVTLSRSGASVPGAQQAISVDLLDQKESRHKLVSLSDVTHVFYAAYLPYPTYAEEVEPNRKLLSNAIEGLEAGGAALQHVTLITGAKYYGLHLGPIPTPAREELVPNLGPNFNRAQEDYLRSRTDARWRWTNLIPTHLTGFATGNVMNLALALGTYASIVRELGIPLYFPGKRAAFEAMTQIIDADQVAQSAIWASTTEAASGQVFNISNGDPTRWSLLWPEIASYFRVEAGEPRQFPLAEAMLEQSDLWRKTAEKQGLKFSNLTTLVNWKFLEFVFAIEFDVVLALGKIRRAGFTRHPDTMNEFKRRFDEYIREGILPKPTRQ